LNNLSVTLDCNSNKLKIIGKFAVVLNITSPESPMKDYFILLLLLLLLLIIIIIIIIVEVVVIVIAAAVIVALLLVVTENFRSLSYRSINNVFNQRCILSVGSSIRLFKYRLKELLPLEDQ